MFFYNLQKTGKSFAESLVRKPDLHVYPVIKIFKLSTIILCRSSFVFSFFLKIHYSHGYMPLYLFMTTLALSCAAEYCLMSPYGSFLNE